MIGLAEPSSNSGGETIIECPPTHFRVARDMRDFSPHRSGRIAVILLVVGMIILSVAVYFLIPSDDQDDAVRTMMLHEVQISDFEAFVTEPGDVESSKNTEVRCEVESLGQSGTAIISIIEEGSQVKKGDELITFDKSNLEDKKIGQEIVVAGDEALLTQASRNLEHAIRTLTEYEEGLFEQEKELYEGEVLAAEELLKSNEASLKHGERLAARGFITQLQLQSEQFAVKSAQRDLAAKTRKLDVYVRFTREKLVGQYEGDITRLTALSLAAKKTLELSQKKLKDIDEQIELCTVRAPSDGQVVYVNDERRGVVIEEGTVIRDQQLVIVLPNLEQMQVDVHINESHVNRVSVGDRVEIILDAAPETPLAGRVKEVAAYPFPRRWHGAPLEYGAVVTIDGPPASIRPGLRAKVKISFASKPNVMQVPIASVIEHQKQHFCLVKKGRDWDVRPVVIGLHSSSTVVVDKGLSVGEMVSMTPFEFIGREDLPDAKPIEGEVAGKQEPVEKMDSQEGSVTMKERASEPQESVPGS